MERNRHYPIIRIATWNICGGFVLSDSRQSYTHPDIAYFGDVLKQISPDIVCLQEVHVSENLDQAAFLAEKLGLHPAVYAYEDSHLQPKCRLAVAILSRWIPTNQEFAFLPNPRMKLVWDGNEVTTHDKGFLLARIKLDRQELLVSSGHLFPFHRFGRRLEETVFRSLRDCMDSMFLQGATSTLIGADMNCDDLSRGLPKIASCFGSAHFASTRPDGRITDHILYPKNWRLVGKQAIQTRADHHLCVADLKVASSGI